MTKLAQLKKELKQDQFVDRKILKEIEREADLMRSKYKVATLVSPEEFQRQFPRLYLEVITSPKFQERHSIGKAFEAVLLNADGFLNDVLSRNRGLYNANQSIINAMDNDKIINYIDIERLLAHLVNSKMSYGDTCEILGMVVGFDAEYLKKHRDADIPNTLYVELLSEFFNSDGSFKLNEDAEYFRNVLLMILNDYRLRYLMLEKCSLIQSGLYEKVKTKSNLLVNAYMELLIKNNARLRSQKVAVDTLEEITPNKKDILISRQPLDELKKYYKNGTLISVPDDVNAFAMLLKECGIDENEQRYILNLVNEELKKLSKERVLKYLSFSDRETYEQAKELLESMNYTAADYYVLVQLIDDLKAAGDILDEANNEDEKAYGLEEISSLLVELKTILSKYEKSVDSDNNFVFLCDDANVPCLKVDSDELDGSFYKMICNGIRKIRKDNQGNFKLVMTNDNMPYRLYDILSSKIHITFIEIDNGIYLLIGADVVGQGYEEMVKRVINNGDVIKNFETNIKDVSTRNALLSAHEQYLGLFNPDAPNISRKRTNQES